MCHISQRDPVLKLCTLFILLSLGRSAYAAGFSVVTPMANAREEYTATSLLDGRVLVVGGYSNHGLVSTAEIYDPKTDTWSSAGTLTFPRGDHTATLLNSGLVLVAGGGGSGGTLSSGELYNPTTNTWSSSASLSTARFLHTATLLLNGQVLIVGGYNNIDSVELYDPKTDTWSNAAHLLTGRWYHSATLLMDGRVLVAGGRDSSGVPLESSELYDPVTNTWMAAGNLVTARAIHTATLLSDGAVLLAGGIDTTASPTPSAERYDPATRVWSAAASLGTGRYFHTATPLPRGRVLCTGGYNGGPLACSELYDCSTNRWISAPPLAMKRYVHTATLLSNGTVLVSGGFADSTILASAEIYDSPQPTVTSITPVAGSSTGGTPVIVFGQYFQAGATVTIGGVPVIDPPVVGPDGTTIICTTPPGAPGAVDVAVTNPDLQSETLPAAFTYVAPPVISTVSIATITSIYGEPVTLSATLNPPASGKTITFSVSGVTAGTARTNVNGVASIGSASTIAVGSVEICASFSGDASLLPSTGNGTLTITPAPLTIVANADSKPYGSNNPAFTGTISGVLPEDQISASFESLANISTAAGYYGPASPNAITPVLKDLNNRLSNYSVTSIPGTFTIYPAPLKISADNKSRFYNQANPTFTATYAGLVNGDKPADLGLNLLFSTSADVTSSVGNYPISVQEEISSPVVVTDFESSSITSPVAYGDGVTYFASYMSGVYWLMSYSASTGPVPIKSFASSINEMAFSNHSLYLTVSKALWRSDGTVLNTQLVLQPTSTQSVNELKVNGSFLYFKLSNYYIVNQQYFVWDSPFGGHWVTYPQYYFQNGSINRIGSSGLITQVTSATETANVSDSAVINGVLYYADNNQITATNGTSIILNNESLAGIAALDNDLYFATSIPVNGEWTTTLFHYDVSSGIRSQVSVLGPSARLDFGSRGHLIYTRYNNPGQSLWSYDPVTEQKLQLASYPSGFSSLSESPKGVLLLAYNPGAQANDVVEVELYSDKSLNYAISNSPGTLTLTQALPTISWPSPTNIVYGTPVDGALNATADVPGTFTYTPPAGTVLRAGMGQVLEATFTPLDAVNYSETTDSVRLSVTPAPLTVTAEDKTRISGMANPQFTASFTGTLNGQIPPLGMNLVFNTQANTDSAPGSYQIQVDNQPRELLQRQGLIYTDSPAFAGNTCYFTVYTETNSNIWKSAEGTASPLTTYTDNVYAYNAVCFNDSAYFIVFDRGSSSNAIWRADPSGIAPVFQFAPNQYPAQLKAFNNELYFVLTDYNVGTSILWQIGADGVNQVLPLSNGQYISEIAGANGVVYFTAIDYLNLTYNVWKLDNDGVAPITNFPITYNGNINRGVGTLTIVDDLLYFILFDLTSNSRNLWVVDTNGARALTNLGSGQQCQSLTPAGGAVYFTIFDSGTNVANVYKSDSIGTVPMTQFNQQTSIGALVALGDAVFYTVQDSSLFSMNIWRSGTSGSQKLTDFPIGWNTSAIAGNGSALYFSALRYSPSDARYKANIYCVEADGEVSPIDSLSNVYIQTLIPTSDSILPFYEDFNDHRWKLGIVSNSAIPAANYDVAYVSGNLIVNPAITWPRPADITYGTQLSVVQLDADVHGVPGTIAYSPAAGTFLDAGPNQTLSVTFTPDDASIPASNISTTINVLPAIPQISWSKPANLTYGLPLGSVQLNAAASDPNPNKPPISGVYTYAPAEGAVLPAGIGQALTVTFVATDPNFVRGAIFAAVPINVLPAQLTVTADSQVSHWGNPLPTFSASYSGLTHGDTPASLGLALSFVTAATSTSDLGQYQVALSNPSGAGGAGASNYNVSYLPGTLTLTNSLPVAQDQTITINENAGPTSILLTASDADSDALTYQLQYPTAGILTGTPPNLVYTPAVNDYGTRKFGFVVVDPYGRVFGKTSNNATVTIIINHGTPLSGFTVNPTPAAAGKPVTFDASAVTAATGTISTYAWNFGDGTVSTVTGPITAHTYASSKLYTVKLTITDTLGAVATSTNSLQVWPVNPAITWANPAAITYPAPLTDIQLNATANVTGAFSYSPPLGVALNAGIGQVLTVTFTPTDAATFNTVTKTAKITVKKSTPIITWTDPAPITVGTALDSMQLNATANVPGSLVYNPAAGTVLPKGKRTLKVTFTPTDTANYTTVSATVTLVIN